MWKLKKFVSNKEIFIYTFVYMILRATFILTPLVSGYFVDSSVAKDVDKMKLFAILSIGLFLASQGIMYIFDIVEGKTKTSAVSNLY